MATTFRATDDAFPRASDGGVMSWVIERAGEAIGCLEVSVGRPGPRPRRARVTGLFVRPEERGRGVGALALRFAGEVGRALGLTVYAAGMEGEDAMPAERRVLATLS